MGSPGRVLLLPATMIFACADYTVGDQPAAPAAPRCGEPSTPSCGGHGRCAETSGALGCACDAGYDGPACEACAANFQDNDQDGTCLPSCGTLVCKGAHERCGDATAAGTCACAPGYVRELAGCVFRGGPRDPTLENKPAAWSTTLGTLDGFATKNPTGANLLDPGLAKFDLGDVCDGKARLAQTFEMPTAAEAEPLALHWAGTSDFFFSQVGVSSRGAWLIDLPMDFFGGGGDQKRCIGEKWLGKTVDLVIDGQTPSCQGQKGRTLVIDHVGVERDATCPAVGEIPNPTFDGTGGWVAQPGAGTAEVANGVGTAQSRGGRLASAKFCQSPQLQGSMSPRQNGAKGLALKFTYRGTKDQRMDLATSRGTLGYVRGTNVFESASFCIPEALKGDAVDLYARLQYRSPSLPSTCDAADVREFVFDDLSFGPDPKCPDAVHVVDGGFEDTGVSQSWLPYDVPGQSSVSKTTGHAGKTAPYLSVSRRCYRADLAALASVPMPTATAGPALKFWVRGSLAAGSNLQYTFGTATTVPSAWEKRTACIPPKQAGRPTTLTFSLYGGDGLCADAASSQVAIDDVEMTTDPSCPTK